LLLTPDHAEVHPCIHKIASGFPDKVSYCYERNGAPTSYFMHRVVPCRNGLSMNDVRSNFWYYDTINPLRYRVLRISRIRNLFPLVVKNSFTQWFSWPLQQELFCMRISWHFDMQMIWHNWFRSRNNISRVLCVQITSWQFYVKKSETSV